MLSRQEPLRWEQLGFAGTQVSALTLPSALRAHVAVLSPPCAHGAPAALLWVLLGALSPFHIQGCLPPSV